MKKVTETRTTLNQSDVVRIETRLEGIGLLDVEVTSYGDFMVYSQNGDVYLKFIPLELIPIIHKAKRQLNKNRQ